MDCELEVSDPQAFLLCHPSIPQTSGQPALMVLLAVWSGRGRGCRFPSENSHISPTHQGEARDGVDYDGARWSLREERGFTLALFW
jgi:hypothetical protein